MLVLLTCVAGTGESWKAVVVAFKVMAMGRERIDMAPFGTY